MILFDVLGVLFVISLVSCKVSKCLAKHYTNKMYYYYNYYKSQCRAVKQLKFDKNILDKV